MGSNQRHNFIVNPKFQLKISAYVAILVFISSIIYPFTIYDLMESFIAHISANSNLNAEIFKEKRNDLILVLSIWQLGFIALVFIGCIFITHKIAGPMHKMQKFLRGVIHGDFYGKVNLRQGDYFTEVADDLNIAFEQIGENYKKDIVYLSEVEAYLKNLSMVVPEDKQIILQEISSRLKEIQNRFNQLSKSSNDS